MGMPSDYEYIFFNRNDTKMMITSISWMYSIVKDMEKMKSDTVKGEKDMEVADGQHLLETQLRVT
jgi:hypothetical protein